MEPLDLPPAWSEAIGRAAAASTVLVLGPTDVGKSSFIRALAEARPDITLLDLDPGQKMVGPPGSASLGTLAPAAKLERFVFLGSTAIGSFRQLLAAAARLTPPPPRPVVVNTSGYVAGPGARLQILTVENLRPDLVVAIGIGGPLDAAIAAAAGPRLVRLAASPLARRKSDAVRRANRRGSFEAALAGAGEWRLERASIAVEPGPPAPFPDGRRPVCALADGAGEDMEIGLLCAADDAHWLILSRKPPRPVRRLRLGRMWASWQGGLPLLLDALAPAWEENG